MMTSLENEHRKSPRLPLNLEYRLMIDDILYSGDIRNISLSGAYLASIKPELSIAHIAHQGLLSINSNDKWIPINCKIVYISDRSKGLDFPEGVGITFCQDNGDIASEIWNIAIQSLV